MRGSRAAAAAVLAGLSLLAGCAALEQELARRQPTAAVESMRLAGLGFDAAEVVLDVRIDNPNPVAIELDGFDYELRLAGRTLLSGDRRRRATVPADGSGRIEVPLRLVYEEVYAAARDLGGRDAVDYAVDLALRVDVPALGRREIRLTAGGRLPLPRPPRVELRSLRLDALDAEGARVVLDLGVDNPNAFGVTLAELRYTLRVDDRRWASGSVTRSTTVPARGIGGLSLPLELDFGAIGGEAHRVLTGSGAIDYTLEGRLEGVAGDTLLGEFDVPFSRSGRLPAAR